MPRLPKQNQPPLRPSLRSTRGSAVGLAAAGSARSRSLPETNSRSRSSFLAVRRELVSSSPLPQPGLCRLAFVPLRVASSSNLLSGPPASVRGADYFRSPRSTQSSGKFSARSTSGAPLGILGSGVRDGTPAAAQRGKAQHASCTPCHCLPFRAPSVSLAAWSPLILTACNGEAWLATRRLSRIWRKTARRGGGRLTVAQSTCKEPVLMLT